MPDLFADALRAEIDCEVAHARLDRTGEKEVVAVRMYVGDGRFVAKGGVIDLAVFEGAKHQWKGEDEGQE